jgi:hypothetical protein
MPRKHCSPTYHHNFLFTPKSCPACSDEKEGKSNKIGKYEQACSQCKKFKVNCKRKGIKTKGCFEPKEKEKRLIKRIPCDWEDHEIRTYLKGNIESRPYAIIRYPKPYDKYYYIEYCITIVSNRHHTLDQAKSAVEKALGVEGEG